MIVIGDVATEVEEEDNVEDENDGGGDEHREVVEEDTGKIVGGCDEAPSSGYAIEFDTWTRDQRRPDDI